MEDLFGLALAVGSVAFLLGLGLFVGGAVERAHFKRLAEREEEIADVLVTQLASYPDIDPRGRPPEAFFAEVVVASDYLKNFLAGFRRFFGGEILSYQRLMDRARREAILRLVEQARAAGFDALCNVRVETADVGGNNANYNKKQKAMMAPILASATAYQRR